METVGGEILLIAQGKRERPSAPTMNTTDTTSKSDSPFSVYVERKAERQATANRWDKAHNLFGNLRLATVAVLIVLAALVFGSEAISPLWLALPIVTFILLARRHDAILQHRQKAERAVRHYDCGLRRLRGHWQKDGVTGRRFLKSDHPYAFDLDVFGTGSLFQLLCRARTEAGEACLAIWLLAGASPDSIHLRQAAIDELRFRIDLREDMSVLGTAVNADLDTEAIRRWGTSPAIPDLVRLRAIAAGFTVLYILTMFAAIYGHSYSFLIISLAVGYALLRSKRRSLEKAIGTLDRPARSLSLFAQLLGRLETETFQSPLLRDIAARLDLASHPQQAVTNLTRLCELLAVKYSELLMPIDKIFLFTFQVGLATEAWRGRFGARLPDWLEAMGELEALLSLAGYAYERPADPFPTVVETEICFNGEAIGHPLISAAKVVRNNVQLNAENRVIIVSGSNMSGKSTYLRAVGINTVLALAGAPVCAEGLRLSVWQLGTSIQTNDSLRDGISRFYAELLRLSQIVAQTASPVPVLFLLDEILHGTNSHDRLIGAEAIIKALVRERACGLVTTHDLALAEISQDESLRAVNVHFADDIQDGKMAFDYRVRPGVVRQSNAIALMRIAGLDV